MFRAFQQRVCTSSFRKCIEINTVFWVMSGKADFLGMLERYRLLAGKMRRHGQTCVFFGRTPQPVIVAGNHNEEILGSDYILSYILLLQGGGSS